MALNESIRALRRERGMTQEQLAEAMNVSAAAVSKWENGQSVPDIAMLTALADFYEVSLDALVGYTIHPCRREEAVERIRRLARLKRYPEAIAEAKEALRRYPNHFGVVYYAGRTYGFYGMEHGEQEALRTAIGLMERAMALIGQNADPAVRPETLWTNMGMYHAGLEEREQAIRCYEAGNIGGVNDIAIAANRAALGQYAEALPPLSHGLIAGVTRIFNAGTGALRCMMALGQAQEAEALAAWLLRTLEGMEASEGSYVLKMKTLVHGWSAAARLQQGRTLDAREQMRQAVRCARQFDASPDYSLQGFRFYQGGEHAMSDGMGETAMDALRRTIEQNPAVRDGLLMLLEATSGSRKGAQA